ncbi:hypothetical protein G3A43_07270 [Paraburkholderia aspalathi]|nr:hypothetical protein [Paraburkholderia aspalathi]MBK3780053.1 hypothetical protein [Paraburkholderia aspalathi]
MTQDIKQPELLAELTFEQIKTRQVEVRRLLDLTELAISRLSTRREGLLDRAELAELPVLTVKVIQRLKRRHAAFLTPSLESLAGQHAKLWGIFNRKGTLAALQILRKKYRGYMVSVGFVEGEDRDLAQQYDQKLRLREELFKLEQLEILLPTRGVTVPLDELAADVG